MTDTPTMHTICPRCAERNASAEAVVRRLRASRDAWRTFAEDLVMEDQHGTASEAAAMRQRFEELKQSEGGEQ